MEDEYYIGECSYCDNILPLKNGVCVGCTKQFCKDLDNAKEIEIPDIFKDILDK